MASAGRAHHAAVGGPSHTWAEWYAEFLIENGIADHVGFDPDADLVASWLMKAHAEHRASAPDERWPAFYAERILSWLAPGGS